MNFVILEGNVGNDAETKEFNNAKAVRFSLATKESWKDKSVAWQSKTTWHNVVAWRDLAKSVEGRIKKGMELQVTGKLEYNEKDGKTYTKIVANSIAFVFQEKKEEKPSQEGNDVDDAGW